MHDTHFLSRLGRVDDEHVALAMALYRDPELVKAVLARVSAPDGVDRVALALEDGPGAPHVVLGRNGHFVTCLGPGMVVGDLPIISRARLEGAKAQLAVLRERQAAARKALGPGSEGAPELFQRLLRAGPRLSREEFQALLTLVPFLWLRLLQLHATLGTRLERERERLRRRRAPRRELAARTFTQEAWATCHLASLVLADWPGRDEALDHLAGREGMLVDAVMGIHESLAAVSGIVRSAHALGRLGKRFLPTLKQIWLGERPPAVAGTPLVVAAAGHAKLTAEIVKQLERGRANDIGQLFIDSIRKGTEHREVIAEWGRALAQARIHVGEHLVFETPEEVPDDVVTAVFASHSVSSNTEDGFDQLFLILPFVARAKPEELYLPAALASNLDAPSAEEQADLWLDSAPKVVAPEAVRRPPGPGRNDPCSCGSGKKFKKCCGA